MPTWDKLWLSSPVCFLGISFWIVLTLTHIHQASRIYKEKKQNMLTLRAREQSSSFTLPRSIWHLEHFFSMLSLAVSQKHRSQPARLESGPKQRSLRWTPAVRSPNKCNCLFPRLLWINKHNFNNMTALAMLPLLKKKIKYESTGRDTNTAQPYFGPVSIDEKLKFLE